MINYYKIIYVKLLFLMFALGMHGENRYAISTSNCSIYGGIIADISTGRGIQPRLYNGKELDRTNNLFWYDFLARPYDPTRGKFTNPDQKAEEYYLWNPFTFCLNNPQKYVDPDGTKIIPYLFTEMDESGNALGTPNLIYTKVKNAIIKIEQTTYGKNFLSAFIDEGAKNYGVRGNSRYSNYNFDIRQYNMKDPNEQYLMMRNNSGSLSYTEEGGTLVVIMRLDTQGKTESQITETILHEIALHGTKTERKIQAYQKGGMKAVNDFLKVHDQYTKHYNLKIENRKNKGVDNYIQAREELIKKHSNLKNIFDNEMAKYKENY